MRTMHTIRTGIAVYLAALLASPSSYGLVSIDDGKNQLFVHGVVTYVWDSNIFANASSGGDSIYTASVGMDFRRHAGMIGVNGSVYLDASTFAENTGENFQNPRFNIELTKTGGRTTGSFTAGAARQSRADTAANIRNESWSYNAGINLKYPVIERYTLAGSLNYALRDFKDNSVLVDLSTYSAGIDLYYIYNTERDLIAGYRVRYGETSANSSYYDHAFTVGISGKILPKVGGTVRAGYQVRTPSNSALESHSSLTASGQATWTMTKRMNATILLSKDFTTTSTNITVDSSSVGLDLQYGMNSRTALYFGVGYGINEFLGPNSGGRKDTYFTWNVGGHYTFNDHLKLALTYSYFQNWSTNSFSDFTRNSVNLTATSTF